MASKQQMIDYLKEHLRYEVIQLRHTLGRLHTTENQLDWNAFFVAFCEHAHNLIEFFRTGHSNMKATEYIKGFRVSGRDKLSGMLRKLDQQVRHLAKERTADPTEKFNRDQATLVANWIEQALTEFNEQLPANYPKDWVPPKAAAIEVRRSVPSQSSSPIPSSSSPSMTIIGTSFTATTEWHRTTRKDESENSH